MSEVLSASGIPASVVPLIGTTALSAVGTILIGKAGVLIRMV